MGIGGILFNPQGRINANQFWRGLIILIGLQIVLNVVAAYGPLALTLVIGLASLLFIYPYLCVFGKRLHDSGNTAWWFVAFLVGFFVLSYIWALTLGPIFMPGQAQFEEDLQTLSQSGDINAIMELTREQTRAQMLPGILTTVVMNGIVGFIAARLPSDPDANQYGEPTSGVSDTFS